MITIEGLNSNALLQTLYVWHNDIEVIVDVEIYHDYYEVTKVDVEVRDKTMPAEHVAEIKRAVTDHVEQYFEVPEWEDDPDRVYERRNDK